MPLALIDASILSW